jgi:hypothetical protein
MTNASDKTTTKQNGRKGMNDKFDELAKGLAQSVTRRQPLKKLGVGLAGMALAGVATLSANAQAALGSPIELSQPNPLGGCNDGFTPPGNWTIQDAGEPCAAVNPLNPKNVVALWMSGLIQNIITAASFDGGATWQRTALPLTQCAGGPYLLAGDVWLSFGANGDLYASTLAGNVLSSSALFLVVCKSGDGGLHWSAPVIVAGNSPDHPSITADPTDARFAYAVWDESNNVNRGPSGFSRTTDGGLSWDPPRTLVQPPSQNGIQFSQILVLPDGTLADLYMQYESNLPKKPITQTSLQVLRSTDHGQTWSAPLTAVSMTPLYAPPSNFTLVLDPETGQNVEDPTNPSFAVDRASGNLYAVWEDGRFSNFQYPDIAFSMSADGGFTWSTPIRVNQTPLNIAPLNRQAFIPNIAVAANGSIGVSYYDFRFNTPDPGLPTDRWLVQCRPSAAVPATNPTSWGNEVRLTPQSFNMEVCHHWGGGGFFFIGDYEGLAGTGTGFVATFGAVDQNNVTSVFARRVGQ